MPKSGRRFYDVLFSPTLRLSAVLCRGASQLDDFGHLKAHLFLDYFPQRNIRDPKIFSAKDHGPARATVAGIKLADSARNHVHQDVGITDYLQGSFDEFSVHRFIF
jgi:hypothetical protein